VENSLPKKKEYLLYAPLTRQQKELYDAIVARNIRPFLIAKKIGEVENEINEMANKDHYDGKLIVSKFNKCFLIFIYFFRQRNNNTFIRGRRIKF
jgi:ATP-dependent DNA helicase